MFTLHPESRLFCVTLNMLTGYIRHELLFPLPANYPALHSMSRLPPPAFHQYQYRIQSWSTKSIFTCICVMRVITEKSNCLHIMTYNFLRPFIFIMDSRRKDGPLLKLGRFKEYRKVNNKQGYSRLLDHFVIVQLWTHDHGLDDRDAN